MVDIFLKSQVKRTQLIKYLEKKTNWNKDILSTYSQIETIQKD